MIILIENEIDYADVVYRDCNLETSFFDTVHHDCDREVSFVEQMVNVQYA
jgi:hypothetical protein